MQFVLDSDALIKLNRAGALGRVLESCECLVPQAVFEEVVVQGAERGYQDAAEIRDLLRISATVVAAAGETMIRGLGFGESAVAALAETTANAVVVSDDGQFLNLMERLGIDSLSPAVLLLTLVRAGGFSAREALGTLGRMRPSIRTDIYIDTRKKLEELVGHDEK